MNPEQQAIHEQLERSATHKAGVDARAQQIAASAEAMFKQLSRALPGLTEAIEHARGPDERADAQRKYLQARQNMHRCSQAWSLARRQSLLAQNL